MRETIQNANGKQFHAVSLSGGIPRFRLKPKAHSLRCFSSPITTHFVGLVIGIGND